MSKSENGPSSQAAVIQAIDSSSIQKITSGQVVVDLQTAVKELVENSLDAGATAIDVKFKDYGLESFEVSDNGSGIREEDLATVGLNHTTSKLTNFDDLAQVKTFGFRGEALSSLCALAKVTVQTATSATEPRGWALEFDKMGQVISKKRCSRPRGTSVNVQSLFHNLPVRRKQFSKEYKKHFGHAQTLLQAYGLISTNLSLNVSNQPSKGSKTFQFQTKSNSHTRHNFSDIFTPKACTLIVDLDLDFKVKPDRTVLRTLGLPIDVTSNAESFTTVVSVKGLMSRPVHGQGRNSPDRQFYYINGRPFNPSKISKCVNEVYKQFNTSQYPAILANFTLPPDAYDLNIDPNKRSIFLHSEGHLIEALREALEAFCQPYRSTFSVTQISSVPEPTLQMTLIQPTLSKRKHLAAQPASQASQIDPPDQGPSQSLPRGDSPDPVTLKKPKLGQIPSIGQAEIAPVSRDPSPALFKPMVSPPPALFKPAVSPPPLATEMDWCDEIPSLNPAPQASSSCSTIQTQEEIPRCDSTGLEPEASPSTVSPKPQGALDKPDWVPSLLRTDSPVGTSAKLVQKTLDTSRASWYSRTSGPPSKPGSSHKKKIATSSERLRTNIQHFLRPGHAKPVLLPTCEEIDDESISEHGQLSSQADTVHNKSAENDDIQILDDHLDIQSEEIVPVDPKSPLEEKESLGPCGDTSHPVDSHPSEKGMSPSSRAKGVPAPDSQRSYSQMRRVVREKEIIPSREPVVVKAPVELDRIKQVWAAHRADDSRGAVETDGGGRASLQGAGLDQDDTQAASTLSRNVQKHDFEAMQIVGQFNLGFIIVRRRDPTSAEDDLFIVDQHASDEKFHFERLQRVTKLTAQRLLVPKVLSLTAAEEITAIEHLEILELNGFSVQIDEAAGVGRRVRLVAQPVSGKTSWDESDLEELLHLIGERGAKEVVRPSKTRRMLASRACRTSTMIGDGLTIQQMSRIVTQMGTMDQPWACPHGRPTMRWLAHCHQNPQRADPRYRIADWIVGKIGR